MPLELFRNRPELAAELLQTVFGFKLPDFAQISLGSEVFNDCDPTEFRCDGTIIVGDPNSPDLGIVLERQLRSDRRKRFTWPVYLATLRARHECPVALLVLCPDEAIADACAEPIETGHPGWVLTPLVLTPAQIPPTTEPAEARRLPELAVLSAPAHADGPHQEAVLDAMCAAIDAVTEGDEDRGLLYYEYVRSQLSVVARHCLEEIMKASTYEFESDFARRFITIGEAQGEARGEARGEAKALLSFLEARHLTVSDEARERIISCTDLDQLETWIQRAATVDSVEELFG
ncbi:hypothetical protein [Actinomadura sp. HBU206391]|uniref:hypothetical protein n=1 Tax=Actinomadura sp. HBU206391 TaxID=2731692 RepID=UPI0016507972|nr:hypothetical protein [Actinomadura sp. HBU206391]MBC6456728.1 hypothetical protein [Actinomadura sp. HBU206391]